MLYFFGLLQPLKLLNKKNILLYKLQKKNTKSMYGSGSGLLSVIVLATISE